MLLSTFQDIDNNIQKWFPEEKWPFSEVIGSSFRKGYIINMGRKIGVIIEHIDRITIQHKFILDEDMKNSYRLSSLREKFFYDLRIQLMALEVNTKLSTSIDEFDGVDIRKYVYFDGFSRHVIINSIFKMFDAVNLVGILWDMFISSSKNLSKKDMKSLSEKRI